MGLKVSYFVSVISCFMRNATKLRFSFRRFGNATLTGWFIYKVIKFYLPSHLLCIIFIFCLYFLMFKCVNFRWPLIILGQQIKTLNKACRSRTIWDSYNNGTISFICWVNIYKTLMKIRGCYSRKRKISVSDSQYDDNSCCYCQILGWL